MTWYEALLSQIDEASSLRCDQLRRMPPLVDGWDIAGSIVGDSDEASHGGLYDWSVRDDGALSVSCGCAEAHGLVAALTATSLLAALRSHVCYRHTAPEMLSRLNQTVWTGSTGDQFARLWYGVFCPRSGKVRFSVAGPTHMLLVRRGKLQWMEEQKSNPLGLDPEAQYAEHHLRLEPGDELVVWTNQAGMPSGDALDMTDRVVRRCRGLAAADLMVQIADAFQASSCFSAANGTGLVVMRRCQS